MTATAAVSRVFGDGHVWTKSSRSAGGADNCLYTRHDQVASYIRDSKTGPDHGPVLAVGHADFAALTRHAAGRADAPGNGE